MAIKTKKRCKTCNELKVVTEFEEKGRKQGVMQYGNICMECKDSKTKKMFDDPATIISDEVLEQADELASEYAEGKRTCRVCGITKDLSEYYKDRVSNGIQRYRGECKTCAIESSKDRTKKYNDTKAQLVHDLTEEQWRDCCDFFDGYCAYCGTGPIEEREHIIPVSEGGGYTASNIIPACKRCNTSKGRRQLTKWFVEVPWFSRDRLAKILEWVKKHVKQE